MKLLDEQCMRSFARRNDEELSALEGGRDLAAAALGAGIRAKVLQTLGIERNRFAVRADEAEQAPV
ncbi:hypothetical protein ACLF3G_26200 [Falsiroseomonas sp. HC035]|uniref:hypothetical protein n=1 Tax=Falsiroseomonas sp. HC035 TaxID=3390999 RepID=UPI003D3225EB